jgi:hypothetical protein
MKSKYLFVIAAVLVVLGIALMAMPTPGEPDLQCAPAGAPPSGVIDNDQGGCNVTIESSNEYADWTSKPKIDNIAGLVLVVAGLGAAGYGAFRMSRERRSAPQRS